MTRLLFTLAFLLCGRHLARAEGLMCTQMWCDEALNVTLHADDWPMGDYTFTVQADGKSRICKTHLPFANCEDAVAQCDGQGVTVGLSGCALPKDQQGFASLRIAPPPKHFSLTIDTAGGSSGRQRFVHDATVDQKCGFPNGEQCDPRPCCSAAMDMPVVWTKY